jgi:outer membrane protein TolC
MNLSWSVLALVLIGAQDQQPSQPKSPGSSVTVKIKIGSPEQVGSQACCKASTASYGQPAIVAKPDGPEPGVLTKVAGLCAERLVTYVLDEAKAVACAQIAEVTGRGAKTKTCTKDEKTSAAPAQLLSATLSMPLPKVAKPRMGHDPEAKECWPMTLQEAIRIALDNNEIVRVIAFGAQGIPIGGFEPTPLNTRTSAKPSDANLSPIVIARLNADASFWRFKAEIMAEVRSVEQQYWNLAQAHVQLWAADRAVSMAKEIHDREQAELQVGRGTVADVAESAQRLEQFQLDVVTRTSDVITTERQLRNLLGLPPADNRRIIPVTPPTEENVEFDWDTCLNEMMDEQPDVVQQQLLVRVAELQLLIARNQLLPELSLHTLDQLNGLGRQSDGSFAVTNSLVLRALQSVAANPETDATLNGKTVNDTCFLTNQVGYCLQIPMGIGRSPLANTRQSQYILLRSRSYLHQIVHQTTHSLARFFLEVDANYKQYKTAARLRKTSAERLDAQRAYYEEGRITIDRFLDAVSQYATAVATEAQYKTTYNIALAALAEAKGTLLADRGIVIAEGPHPRKAYVRARDIQGAGPAESGPAQAHATTSKPAAKPTPTPPRWAEVTAVVRRAPKRDLYAMIAGFEPGIPWGRELPRLVPLTFQLTAPSPVVSQADAARLCPTIPGYGMPSPATDTNSTRKAQAVSTDADGTCEKSIVKTDTACTTAKADQPAKAKTKTWSFSLSIGGANPLQIKGTITETEADAQPPTRQ